LELFKNTKRRFSCITTSYKQDKDTRHSFGKNIHLVKIVVQSKVFMYKITNKIISIQTYILYKGQKETPLLVLSYVCENPLLERGGSNPKGNLVFFIYKKNNIIHTYNIIKH
jgi:hypothetical protein